MTTGVFSIPLISMDGSAGVSSENTVATATPRHFIAGPENFLLRLLTNSVLSPPSGFNPLTLCGPTGVGKSHLLYGLVARHKTFSPESPVSFLSGADFARGFARAIELDCVSEWREKQRGVDLFVLDDVHELSNKPAAQLELVYTLDTLLERDRQVILASQQMPLDWNWMLPNLRSRIEGGLTIPVSPPGPESQQQILREISAAYSLSSKEQSTLLVPNDSLTYSRIRHAVLNHAQRLPGFETTLPRRNIASRECLSKIAKSVARQSQIRLADLLGPSRRQSIVHARGTAMYLARILLRLSFDDIGQYFGGRDHTTVLHSYRKTTKRLETNPQFEHEVKKLIGLLRDNFEIQRY